MLSCIFLTSTTFFGIFGERKAQLEEMLSPAPCRATPQTHRSPRCLEPCYIPA